METTITSVLLAETSPQTQIPITPNKTELTSGEIQMYYISLVLAPVTFLAIVANTLTAVSIVGATKPLSPHLRFLLSLSISDLVVGIGVSLRLDQVLRGQRADSINMCQSVLGDTLYATGLLANLGNLASIAVDHDMAISKPLQHNLLMTARRANLTVVFIWVVATTMVGVRFLAPLWELSKAQMQQVYMCKYLLATSPFHAIQVWIILIVTLLCGITLMVSYVRLVFKLRSWVSRSITKHHTSATTPVRRATTYSLSQDKPVLKSSTGGSKRSPKRQTRKALVTTLLLVGTFLLCWLPSGVCLTAYDILRLMDVAPDHRTRLAVTVRFVWSLVIANTLTDPIIYASRIPEVKRGFRNVFSIFLCCRRRQDHYEMTQNTQYGSTVFSANGRSEKTDNITHRV